MRNRAEHHSGILHLTPTSPHNNRHESRPAQVPHPEDDGLRMMTHTQVHISTAWALPLMGKNFANTLVEQLAPDLVDRSHALNKAQRRRNQTLMMTNIRLDSDAIVRAGPRAQVHRERPRVVYVDVDAGDVVDLFLE